MATNRGTKRNRDLESDSIIQQNLEDENENSINSLVDKVKDIKNLSLGIKNFIGNEKKQLNNMMKDYDKSSSLMDLSMKKMDQIMNSKAGRLSCYLSVCVLFVFVVLYALG
mmetsp:Transcript_70864/g.82527  ORF Transcript_70864/g.82527 Transcript_70864/m.82527 type:complete len:111 (+) Transcript_70864:47-379(+)